MGRVEEGRERKRGGEEGGRKGEGSGGELRHAIIITPGYIGKRIRTSRDIVFLVY